MHALVPLLMTLIFGAPSFGAMTPLLWAEFALNNGPTIIKDEAALIAFLKTPAGRAMLARNGEAAIRWQQRQMEF